VKKMTGKVLRAICVCFMMATGAFAQSQFMPVDQIHAGMKGVGRTVFEGTKIEEFQVEVLGVLKNFGPKQDLILARISGGPIERTGVIQGMSGSPIYIDGKLVGALAYAFPYAKDPIAGIQPIGQMVSLLDQTAPAKASSQSAGIFATQSPTAYINGVIASVMAGRPLYEVLMAQAAGIFSDAGNPTVSGGSLSRIQSPLFVSGASSAAVREFAPFFNSLGFNPVQSGGAGTIVSAMPTQRLEPGSPVSAEMVRGDMSASANGTVTYVDGDKVYAFGHPFLSGGPINLPMSAAEVITVLPKLDTSMKLAFPTGVVGAFRQDRSTGISGKMGDKPDMIPISLSVKSSSNTVNHFNVEVANDRAMTASLTAFAVFNAITASEREQGEMTLDITGQVHLKDYEPVKIANVFTSDTNGASLAAIAAVAPLQYLMSTAYDAAVIQSVDLNIVSVERRAAATLERVSLDRVEARAGDTVTLSAVLRGVSGEMFVERYPIQIPSGLAAGTIQMLIGDGTTITTSELRRGPTGSPRDLRAAIAEINKLRRNDRLYIKILSNEPGAVIGGEEMPSLPPSLMAVLATDRGSNRGVSSTSSSTVREYELPQSKYVIQGQRSLTLTVRP
jgi:hypothetical protein